MISAEQTQKPCCLAYWLSKNNTINGQYDKKIYLEQKKACKNDKNWRLLFFFAIKAKIYSNITEIENKVFKSLTAKFPQSSILFKNH